VVWGPNSCGSTFGRAGFSPCDFISDQKAPLKGLLFSPSRLLRSNLPPKNPSARLPKVTFQNKWHFSPCLFWIARTTHPFGFRTPPDKYKPFYVFRGSGVESASGNHTALAWGVRVLFSRCVSVSYDVHSGALFPFHFFLGSRVSQDFFFRHFRPSSGYVVCVLVLSYFLSLFPPPRGGTLGATFFSPDRTKRMTHLRGRFPQGSLIPSAFPPPCPKDKPGFLTTRRPSKRPPNVGSTPPPGLIQGPRFLTDVVPTRGAVFFPFSTVRQQAARGSFGTYGEHFSFIDCFVFVWNRTGTTSTAVAFPGPPCKSHGTPPRFVFPFPRDFFFGGAAASAC